MKTAAIPLVIDADQQGGGTTSVTISGLPNGAVLSAGTHNSRRHLDINTSTT